MNLISRVGRIRPLGDFEGGRETTLQNHDYTTPFFFSFFFVSSFKLGRIPLHYVGSTTEPDRIWELLVSAGSNVDVEDANGRTPLYYLTNDAEIHLPDKTRYGNLCNEGNPFRSVTETRNLR